MLTAESLSSAECILHPRKSRAMQPRVTPDKHCATVVHTCHLSPRPFHSCLWQATMDSTLTVSVRGQGREELIWWKPSIERVQ